MTLSSPLNTQQLELESTTTLESQLQQKQSQEEIGQKSIDKSFASIDTRIKDRRFSKKSVLDSPNKYVHKSIANILKSYSYGFGTISGCYFISYVHDPTLIKIGKAKCLESRIESYLTHYPKDIRVLACIRADTIYHGLEKELHDLFHEYRYLPQREWFFATRPLLDAIDFIKEKMKFEPYTLKANGQYVYDDPDYVRRMVYETIN